MMRTRGGSPPRRRGKWSIPIVTLALVVIGVAGVYRLGYLNDEICGGPCPAEFFEAPEAVTQIAAARPETIGDRPLPGRADPAKVAAAVAPALKNPALGQVGFSAIGLSGGALLWDTGDRRLIPASTNKLFTTFAALSSMDPQLRFTTTVVRTKPATIVLVGGGDPYLQAEVQPKDDYPRQATLPELADATAAALKADDVVTVRLGYDNNLFSGPSASPDWDPTFVSTNVVTRISALWADQGVVNSRRVRFPAKSAAQIFASELAERGIKVNPEVFAVDAADDAPAIASVSSPTVHQIVQLVNLKSDNEGAEVLFRQIALATGREGSFAGGQAAVSAILEGAEIDLTQTRIVDGSGLSSRNYTTPTTLARTLYAASQRQRTKILLSDLPVAGFNGTLANRFDTAGSKKAVGAVRAKTGTLTGVRGLAGLAIDADGRPIAFAILANDIPGSGYIVGRAAIDAVAAAIATCHCG